MGRGTVCSSLVPDPRSMVPLPSAHCQMPSALSNPTLNGHALPNRNGSISLSPQSDPSASSARSAVSSDSPHFVAPSLGRSVASSTDAWSPVPGPLSLNNNELITDLLAGEFLLPYIAARHNVPLSALNAWVESEEVQSLLASCRRISEWRARFIALDSIPRSIHGLITTMDQCPGTEKARRAATTIINLAFKKDLSLPRSVVDPPAPRHHSDHASRLNGRGRRSAVADRERQRPGEGSGVFPTSSGFSRHNVARPAAVCRDGRDAAASPCFSESNELRFDTADPPHAGNGRGTPMHHTPESEHGCPPAADNPCHETHAPPGARSLVPDHFSSVVSPLPDSRAPT